VWMERCVRVEGWMGETKETHRCRWFPLSLSLSLSLSLFSHRERGRLGPDLVVVAARVAQLDGHDHPPHAAGFHSGHRLLKAGHDAAVAEREAQEVLVRAHERAAARLVAGLKGAAIVA